MDDSKKLHDRQSWDHMIEHRPSEVAKFIARKTSNDSMMKVAKFKT